MVCKITCMRYKKWTDICKIFSKQTMESRFSKSHIVICVFLLIATHIQTISRVLRSSSGLYRMWTTFNEFKVMAEASYKRLCLLNCFCCRQMCNFQAKVICIFAMNIIVAHYTSSCNFTSLTVD